ncbi:penicillin-binding protein [bacterium LRH843]|nr:penicillin-binding protein [bacterium LRH843]
MLKVSTGWALIISFFIIFSFLLIEAISEVKNIQSFSSIGNNVQWEDISLSQNSAIYDRSGELIADLYRDENRIYLDYEDIPELVIHAFIATEDQRFFDHHGFDAISIARAVIANVQNRGIEEGASTMTQQLARNLFLTHEQTYDRKLRELLYAYKLEEKLSKQEIIELYINTIYFQHGVYGMEAAAHYYFNKTSKELSLAEIAFLSSIPNNPSYYDPVFHSDRTKLRQEWVLQKMHESAYINADEYERAVKVNIVLNIQKRTDHFPDYVTYIYHELNELIAVSEGYDLQLNQASTIEGKVDINKRLQERVEQILASGVRIDTALDPILQQRAIQLIDEQLPQSNVQGVAVMIDHEQAEIVAITGGKQYRKFDFHRGYQSYRQPGSAIKPLLVYAPYVEEYDVSLQSKINADRVCYGHYCPRNFGGGQYGMVNLETAFKRSYNTSAVRILDLTGIETAFSYLKKLPFSKITPEDFHLPSALGGFTYGMSPLEMTRAYTTFAQNGSYIPSYGIRSVTDRDGNTLYSWDKTKKNIWSSSTNDLMRKLLAEVIQSGTAQKAKVATAYSGGKTGTTNDFHDFWFIGLTDTYTTGVWVGKDTPSNLSSLYSRAPHLSIWKKLQEETY